MNKIELGNVINIPSEKADYIVSVISGNIVKLTNYKTKAILTMDYEAALEIKQLVEVDISGHNIEYSLPL